MAVHSICILKHILRISACTPYGPVLKRKNTNLKGPGCSLHIITIQNIHENISGINNDVDYECSNKSSDSWAYPQIRLTYTRTETLICFSLDQN